MGRIISKRDNEQKLLEQQMEKISWDGQVREVNSLIVQVTVVGENQRSEIRMQVNGTNKKCIEILITRSQEGIEVTVYYRHNWVQLFAL